MHVCLSGGVDSSVAAVLLREQGYSLKPVFMRNWDTLDEDLAGSGGCEWEKDWDDVQRLCEKSLGGVKPELIDLSKEYWSEVFEPALSGWGRGVTPNPDVDCNRSVGLTFNATATHPLRSLLRVQRPESSQTRS